MTEKQYSLVKCYNEMWGIYDRKQSAIDNPILIAYSKARVGFIVNQLNNKNERIKELEGENKNQNNILEDFMVMLNKLQAEPNNKSLQSMAKDMLQMMGKDIMGDSE